MRKHLSWYVKGLPGAAALRVKINTAKTEEELRELLMAYYHSIISFGLPS
jgi:tRNA-dihydrouridine synthase